MVGMNKPNLSDTLMKNCKVDGYSRETLEIAEIEGLGVHFPYFSSIGIFTLRTESKHEPVRNLQIIVDFSVWYVSLQLQCIRTHDPVLLYGCRMYVLPDDTQCFQG